MNSSLDPRVKRVVPNDQKVIELAKDGCFATYEVFTQKKTGAQHIHQGIVHAPNAEMALVFAKELYGRRLACVNIWVVKTSDILTTKHEDADMFSSATSPEKKYRDPAGFMVKKKIEAFKAQNKK